MKLLIKNGRVVHPVTNAVLLQDLLAEDGKIALLDRGIQCDADQVIDATGLSVSPGLVDMHVHLCDPGEPQKEDMCSGTAAAVRGGITTLACMADTVPPVDRPELVSYIRSEAAKYPVQVLPVGAVSRGLHGEELTDAEALKAAGVVALSDDRYGIENANLMRDALIRARRQELPVLCHCEEVTMVADRALNEGSVSRQLWLEGRPAIAEELMVMRDAMLAEETGSPIHICHVSTAKSVDIIRRMKHRGVPVTCETCPQYFSLTEDEILTCKAMARVTPPLRTKKDIHAIISGLRDGTIDAIASNHTPVTDEEKARSLSRAASGMVGMETLLAATLTHLYHTGKMDLPAVIRKLTANPSDILGAGKGRMSVGMDADLVIFDSDEEWVVDPSRFASKGHNTPFAGKKLKGKIKYTIIGGKIVYRGE